MFRTVKPTKKGSFVPISMTSYRIPKLQDKPIDFFPNQPSGSKVPKESSKKLQGREDNILTQLQQDRSRRISEINRLEILNASSLKVEQDLKKRVEIASSKVGF